MLKPLPAATLQFSQDSPFQGGNAGSNPAGDANKIKGLQAQALFILPQL